MKILVTADCHLSSDEEKAERYHTLKKMLDWMIKNNINHIIIAGDLFDINEQNYSAFDSLCQHPYYRGIRFIIIPGNHDMYLKKSQFAASNVHIVENTEIFMPDLISMPILFVPYFQEKSMGECIAPHMNNLQKDKWILTGHGDWTEGLKEANPYEPGVYMPLTGSDISIFRPVSVLLGHIHKPFTNKNVHYPGSPLPLHINETGKRRFIILDSENGKCISVPFTPSVLYQQAKITVLPMPDETAYIKNQITHYLNEWDLNDKERAMTQIRINVNGYTFDKSSALSVITEGFNEFKWYNDEKPDLSELFHTDDHERLEITRRTEELIGHLEWPQNENEPDKNQILTAALHVIYGD